MVFTVVTILFVSHSSCFSTVSMMLTGLFQLPLSFLSSLFALDVASFQQAPSWAFAVICMFPAPVSIFTP